MVGGLALRCATNTEAPGQPADLDEPHLGVFAAAAEQARRLNAEVAHLRAWAARKSNQVRHKQCLAAVPQQRHSPFQLFRP